MIQYLRFVITNYRNYQASPSDEGVGDNILAGIGRNVRTYGFGFPDRFPLLISPWSVKAELRMCLTCAGIATLVRPNMFDLTLANNWKWQKLNLAAGRQTDSQQNAGCLFGAGADRTELIDRPLAPPNVPMNSSSIVWKFKFISTSLYERIPIATNSWLTRALGYELTGLLFDKPNLQ